VTIYKEKGALALAEPAQAAMNNVATSASAPAGVVAAPVQAGASAAK
jgi:hypothetical protein